MKTLYPQIEPFQHFFLQTNSAHEVYVEQSGNPQGIAVIFLHGGPCSGTKPSHRCFFDPKKYHIILMDQRGCGNSLPFGELDNNTTLDLMDDMEAIREKLKIEKWLLFSGSWGSTLALLYAQQYTDRVLGIVARGVFLARQKDLDWFAKEGVNRIFPEKWQQLTASIPGYDKAEPIKKMYEIVFAADELASRRATKAWIEWGGQVALMNDYQENDALLHITEKMVKQVKMELHYAKNHYFITENQIINGCKRLLKIPIIIIHGRNDLVCPIEAGLSLSKALPHAETIILSNAGHIASGEDMIDALVNATDRMVDLI